MSTVTGPQAARSKLDEALELSAQAIREFHLVLYLNRISLLPEEPLDTRRKKAQEYLGQLEERGVLSRAPSVSPVEHECFQTH